MVLLYSSPYFFFCVCFINTGWKLIISDKKNKRRQKKKEGKQKIKQKMKEKKKKKNGNIDSIVKLNFTNKLINNSNNSRKRKT